jgi:hypothetical protein
MAGVAPRISVVGGTLSNRITLLRETAEAHLRMPMGDSAFVFRRGVLRVTTDSLGVWTRPVVAPESAASAGQVLPAGNVEREQFFVVRPLNDR